MFVSAQIFSKYYILFLIIATLERIVSTFFRKKTKPTKIIYHRWIFYVLLFSYLFCVFFSIGEYFFSINRIDLSISIFGFIIFGCGVLIRRKAIKDLGDNWSIYIEIKHEHQIINSGIYNILRHPYCIAVVFELLGVCFISNAYYSLYIIIYFHIPLLVVRVILEEKVLKKHFGNLYINCY